MSKTSNGNVDRQVKNLEQVLKALELKREGWSYDDIGMALQVSPQVAYTYVKKALKRTLQEPADELRKLELDRLDSIWKELWPLRANNLVVDRLIKITEQRAKILGLYAPTKVAPTTPDGERPYVDAELTPEERLRRIAALERQIAAEKFANNTAKAMGDNSEELDEVTDADDEDDDGE